MMISYEDFEQVDIRSGTVVRAELFPRAKKPAYKICVDFGADTGVLQTSAQVMVHYTPETLAGRQVVGVVNVGTRNIAGFESQVLNLSFCSSDFLKKTTHLFTDSGSKSSKRKKIH